MNWIYIIQWGISEAEVDFCKKEEVKLAEIKCVWSSCVLYNSYTSVNIKLWKVKNKHIFYTMQKEFASQKLRSQSLWYFKYFSSLNIIVFQLKILQVPAEYWTNRSKIHKILSPSIKDFFDILLHLLFISTNIFLKRIKKFAKRKVKKTNKLLLPTLSNAEE